LHECFLALHEFQSITRATKKLRSPASSPWGIAYHELQHHCIDLHGAQRSLTAICCSMHCTASWRQLCTAVDRELHSTFEQWTYMYL